MYYRGDGSPGLILESGVGLIVGGTGTFSGDVAVNTSTLKVDTGNNRVGVKNANPSYPLDIGYTAGINQVAWRGSSNEIGFLTYGSSTDAGAVQLSSGGAAKILFDAAGTSYINTGSSFGLGTSSPSAALHVNNGASITNLPASTRAIFSNGSGADAISRVGIYAGAGSGFAVLDLGRNDASSRASITYNASADSLAFGTAGGGADMTIDSSGNMGLGGTPVSNGAGSTVLNVNATTGGATIHLTNNTTGTTNSDGSLFVQSGSDLLLINRESGNLKLRTADTDRVTVDASGNFGIGTSSPLCRLDLAGAGGGSPTGAVPAGGVFVRVTDTATVGEGAVLRLQAINGAKETAATISAVHSSGNNGDLAFGVYSGGATHDERMRLDSSGNLLIGYTSSNGSYKLQVNSQIFATNATIATSDGRYKEDVQTLSNATDLVSRLNPVQFKWKSHEIHNLDVGKTDVGFIAQEVQAVLSDTDYSDSVVVTNKTDDEEYLGLGETKLIPLLTAALQEAITKIETLETKVAALEAA